MSMKLSLNSSTFMGKQTQKYNYSFCVYFLSLFVSPNSREHINSFNNIHAFTFNCFHSKFSGANLAKMYCVFGNFFLSYSYKTFKI